MIEKDARNLKHTPTASTDSDYHMSSEKNKYKTFKLIWIQNINPLSPKNFYSILFRDINKGFYLQQRLFPEQLSICPLGSYLKDSKLLMEIPPYGEIFEIDVTSKKSNLIRKIGQVLHDDEYNLTHGYKGKTKLIDYTDENKNQFCVVLESEKQKVIFPCPVIGTAYYFTSNSMREHIFSQNLEAMFYREATNIDKKNRKAVIKLKPGVANNDAPHIVRFYLNDLAKKRWYSIRNSLRGTFGGSSPFSPIIIDFPVAQALRMTVRGLSFPDIKTGKEKILVFDILRENSFFDFDDIKIIRDESEGWTSTPDVKKSPQRTTAHRTLNVLEIEVPTSRLTPAQIKAFVGTRNTNIPNMNVIRKPRMSLLRVTNIMIKH